ncbi:MAG TPA: universal stress protein [Kouleothrix sp.]|uniref:universal stress protein n=1 Tax=Kouleothrix sp. TaxID=2779161 RepID=UPI002C3BEF11|nr:universal stress protein [Kouleothrix sp.]HRC78013.1 universal stress protein [Kouleothrix sp.]
MPKRTMIVPIDGSDFSRRIVPQVSRLYSPRDYAIILLRVAEPAASIIGAPPRMMSLSWMRPMFDSAWDIEYTQHPIYADQIEQSERSLFEQELLEDRHLLEAAGFEVAVEVRFGIPAEEIAAAAEQHRADAIAMATHGRSGLRQLLMGSVAERVLRRVDIPVLMLRPFKAVEN